MIVCYSDELKHKVRVDTMIENHDPDPPKENNWFLIGISNNPQLTSYILINAPDLQSAYDAYANHPMSSATRIDSKKLDRYLQYGRGLMKSYCNAINSIADDIECQLTDPSYSVNDVEMAIDDLKQTIESIESEVINKRNIEWDTDGPYQDRIQWLRDKSDPHLFSLTLNEFIPKNQIHFEYPNVSQLALDNKPFINKQ